MGATSPHAAAFMFATGVENSSPLVKANGSKRRVDQMQQCGHYQHWRTDLERVQQLGIEFLRWGPPYYRTHISPGTYTWEFADAVLGEMRERRITPIIDLCHFGVPDWVGDFQNPSFPEAFAEYAKAFAERYYWTRFFTPVNEIYVAATFSGLYGWWNESLCSPAGFVRSLANLAKANLLAEEAIAGVIENAVFIQSESSEYFHPVDPAALARARFLNEVRFLALDFCYGHEVTASVYRYLIENGLKSDEYDWFLEHGQAMKPQCVMGNDYYATNEHLVHHDGRIEPSGEIFGYYVITKQYFDRCHLPVMHTETNDALNPTAWLWKEWSSMVRLKEDGVPIVGFTWYSLTDQIDWDTALREDNGRVLPVGLCDLERKIRPVGESYRALIQDWKDILAAETICLMDMSTPGVKPPSAKTCCH